MYNLFLAVLLSGMVSNNDITIPQHRIFENVNDRITVSQVDQRELNLIKDFGDKTLADVQYIIIHPKLVEKEMCVTHGKTHQNFDEIDDTCVDTQYYEKDYNKIRAIYYQFKDGTGYHWEG